jgi:aryl-alcohol dehydrogenase-like predicted oxidoreductase
MQTRTIGSLDASVIGLGCNNFGMRIDADASKAVVDAALDAGITLFDTADIYGGTLSEEYLGRALGAHRDEVLIATKFGVRIDDDHPGGAAPAYVASACEASLKRLGTDRIDLYQLHFPDNATPHEDTLGALDELKRAGKVREIGCSNFTAEMLEASAAVSKERKIARYVSVQNEYSLLRRGPERDGVLDACGKLDLAFIPYFPLASGMLTGKYQRNQPPPEGTRLANSPAERQEQAFAEKNFDRVEALTAWAADHGHSLLELAFAWLLARPVVGSVIAGATKPEQARANAAAAGWQLGDADMSAISELLDRGRAS